ncbi:DUF5819 family protein [Streptomyces sp. NPDC003032]
MAAMATTAVLLFHFSMTALYNTPFNPVQKDLSRVITGYMSPQFSQDWHLFAPDPVDADSGILVRAKVRTQDGQDVTGWTDITTPHIAKVHSQRMWPARVDRLPTGVKAQLESWRDPLLEKIRNKNKLDQPKGSAKGGTKAENPPLTVSEKSGRENATRFAQALATSEARRHWGDAVQGIQIRVVSNEYPRFSERHIREVKGKISYYDLDWMKPLKVSG